MARMPKYLITIGQAWVDPREVIAVDDQFGEDTPEWANVRVILRSGQPIFGRRTPERVVQAVRHPDLEHEADEATEAFPDQQQQATARASRRVRTVPANATGIRPVPPIS